MSLSQMERREFEDLMHALCEDLLDEAGEARLSDLLAKHEDAQKLYIEVLGMHADLAWDLRERGRVFTSSVAGSGATDWSAEEPREVSPVLGFLGDIMRGNIHLPGSAPTPWSILALLSCTLALALVCVFVIHGSHVNHLEADLAKVPSVASSIPPARGSRVGDDTASPQSARPPDGTTIRPSSFARLTRTAECRWADAASAHELGTCFAAGQEIRLASGAIELVFDLGVRAVVQGPARLDLVAPGKVFLHVGKMSSEITKPEARGFEVQTPKGSIIDLGTEFGVEVTLSEDVQVHVFKGEVVVHQPTGLTEAAAGQHLLGNQGLRMEGGLPKPWLVKESGETFIRTIDDAGRDRHVVAYWRFEDQPLGSEFRDTMHNSKPVRATVDSSFNGNDLYTFSAGHRPTFSPSVPADVIPQTGSSNRSCLDSSQPTDPSSVRNVYTHSEFSHAAPMDIQKITPAQWTIEASVNSLRCSGDAQTFVGRDTYYTFRFRSDPPRLAFQINEERRFAIAFFDVANRRHQAIAEEPVVDTNRWYHLAATSDGRFLRLYVNALDGRGYLLRASTELPSQGSTALGKGEDRAEWSVGRGRNGINVGKSFQGLIDEVRISDVALSPTDFLFFSKGQGKN
ncbi:MAG: LamG-like jellyroll fold domain-containing protein [Thermoguttaceae bacterium]